MTREEQKALKRQRLREQRRKEREAWEAARGPLDLPFLLLVLVLLVIGLIMLLSASFPSAQAEPGGDPLAYFKRQEFLPSWDWSPCSGYPRSTTSGFVAWQDRHCGVRGSAAPGSDPRGGNYPQQRHPMAGHPGTEFQFQPSEVAKLGVIVYFAASISKKREKMGQFRTGILPYGLLLGFISLLVLMEPHMSGAVLLLGIGAMMMVVGGIDWRWIAAGVGAVGFGAYLMLFTDLMEKIGYNSDRIATWRDAFWDAKDKSYQMAQSFITIGSGGLLGVGLGKSRQKFMFLPEEHNDFIFAVVCEELGLVGATLIMLLFSLLIIRGYWLAIHAKDRFGSLLVVGVTTQIALQTFLNIAVVTGLIRPLASPCPSSATAARSGHPAGGGGGGAVGVQADSRAQKRMIGLMRLYRCIWQLWGCGPHAPGRGEFRPSGRVTFSTPKKSPKRRRGHPGPRFLS